MKAGGVLLAVLQSKDDLLKYTECITLRNDELRTGILKTLAVSKLDHPRVIDVLLKRGVSDVLSITPAVKALFHKLEKLLQVVDRKRKEVSRKSDKIIEGGGESSSSADKVNRLALTKKPALNIKQDFWLIDFKKEIKSVMGRWLLELVGPSPAAGTWEATKPPPEAVKIREQAWKWVPRPKLKDGENPFRTEGGDWLYFGAEPTASWERNRWVFVGRAPTLAFYEGMQQRYCRFKPEEKQTFIVTDNTLTTNASQEAILETWSSDFKAQAEKTKSEKKSIERDEDEEESDHESIDPNEEDSETDYTDSRTSDGARAKKAASAKSAESRDADGADSDDSEDGDEEKRLSKNGGLAESTRKSAATKSASTSGTDSSEDESEDEETSEARAGKDAKAGMERSEKSGRSEKEKGDSTAASKSPERNSQTKKAVAKTGKPAGRGEDDVEVEDQLDAAHRDGGDTGSTNRKGEGTGKPRGSGSKLSEDEQRQADRARKKAIEVAARARGQAVENDEDTDEEDSDDNSSDSRESAAARKREERAASAGKLSSKTARRSSGDDDEDDDLESETAKDSKSSRGEKREPGFRDARKSSAEKARDAKRAGLVGDEDDDEDDSTASEELEDEHNSRGLRGGKEAENRKGKRAGEKAGPAKPRKQSLDEGSPQAIAKAIDAILNDAKPSSDWRNGAEAFLTMSLDAKIRKLRGPELKEERAQIIDGGSRALLLWAQGSWKVGDAVLVKISWTSTAQRLVTLDVSGKVMELETDSDGGQLLELEIDNDCRLKLRAILANYQGRQAEILGFFRAAKGR
jgi:hypothetical protein